jgi:hypothetical protein
VAFWFSFETKRGLEVESPPRFKRGGLRIMFLAWSKLILKYIENFRKAPLNNPLSQRLTSLWLG